MHGGVSCLRMEAVGLGGVSLPVFSDFMATLVLEVAVESTMAVVNSYK